MSLYKACFLKRIVWIFHVGSISVEAFNQLSRQHKPSWLKTFEIVV